MEYHSEIRHKSMHQNEITENSNASCSRPRTKLRDYLISDKPALSYADFHHEITAIASLKISKSSGRQQNHGTQCRRRDDDMVKHISRLPEGKRYFFQEKPLTVSSNEWRQLDKLYKHNPMPIKNSGISPSTSSSSYFSTDGSSSTSSRCNSSSPGYQRRHRSPPQPRLETSLVKNYIRDECFSARGKSPARQITYHLVPQSNHPKQSPLQGHSDEVNHFRRTAASTPSHVAKQKKICVLDQNCSINRSGIQPATFERKISDSNTTSEMGKQQKGCNLDMASSSRGKMRIQESELKKELMKLHEPTLGNFDPACMEEKGLKMMFQKDNVMQFHCSDSHFRVPYPCPLPSTDDDIGNQKTEMRESCSTATTQDVHISAQRFKSPSRSINAADIKLVKPPRVLDRRSGPESSSKVRQPSPIRRLSSAVGSFIRSAGSRENSPLRRSNSKDHVAKPESCTEKSQANSRAKSSPLRRMLDPILKSKAPNANEVAHISKKESIIPGHCKLSEEQLHLSKKQPIIAKSKQGPSVLQALLQVSVKNGLPLLTFAVDNDSDILAATLRKSSPPEKNSPSWIYTFFTVHETKKKNGLWLSPGNKGNGQNYVPNVLAQMKVFSPQKATDGLNLREFALFSVDTGQVDQHATTEFQPTNELAAIVVKFLKPESHKSNEPSVILILPGDVHTIPSKGPISTLTQRWRSGGSCDCGGWDIGCQLRIFNQDACKKSLNSAKNVVPSDEFRLFSQVGRETGPALSLKPYKDRIYSVEFDSSLSLLQAFATSVAVLDCRRSFSESNVIDGRADESSGQLSYPPPHSPVGRV